MGFRAKAAMEIAQLAEEKQTQQLAAYKEKAQGTLLYKEALKGVLEAEKTLADYQLSVANKIESYKKQMDLNAINTEEKRLQTLCDQEEISKEQLIAAQQAFEDQRYALEKASLEKSLDDMAINANSIKDAYLRYANTRDAATKEMIVNEMKLNGKSAEDVIAVFEQLEILYAQHTDKKVDLDKSLKDQQIKNVNEVKNTLKDSMSQAFQDVLTGTTTFSKAFSNIFSSIKKTILKQITDMIAETITTKAFGNLLKIFGSVNDPKAKKRILVKMQKFWQNKWHKKLLQHKWLKGMLSV